MAHLLKYDEWQDGCGQWHCNDTTDLGHGSSLWWLPAKMWNMTPAEYLKMVIEKFKPDHIYHSDDYSFVGWNWKNQTQMRVFKNWINAEARKHNYLI